MKSNGIALAFPAAIFALLALPAHAQEGTNKIGKAEPKKAPDSPKGEDAPLAPPIPAPHEPTPHETPDDTSRSRAYHDENMAKGDYYFKAGYYLKASEAYRVAVLNEPVNPWKKLAFGHALFAIGNYSYASYALRRASASLDASSPFNPDVVSLFPSRKSFEKAVRDLKRYVTYSPRDPAGLSVLGYVLFASNEDDRAREMFQYLQKLPGNANDSFATFFLKQLDARKAIASATPQPVDTPRVEAATPPPRPAPAPPLPAPKPPEKPPVAVAPVQGPPDAGRFDEDFGRHSSSPAPAVAD